jgi:hypothetical protein
MGVEDHPLYPRWLKALENLIEAKERRSRCKEGTAERALAEDDYQDALRAYDLIAREA